MGGWGDPAGWFSQGFVAASCFAGHMFVLVIALPIQFSRISPLEPIFHLSFVIFAEAANRIPRWQEASPGAVVARYRMKNEK